MSDQTFEPGSVVGLEPSGAPCRIEEFIGSGGQGEVYRVAVGGGRLALKWFFPAMATPAQRAGIELLVRKGPPNGDFLWPIELATARGAAGFGYVMRLREPRFKSILDLMKRRVEPTFRALATAGLNLSNDFLGLHTEGLCYRDISFGNAFFDPATGDVLVSDNDNVAVNGAAPAGVLGTPRFMAPEVVRGDATPSTETDLFSLAVLLFYMLVVHHPLEGRREHEIRCLDLPAMTKLYGTDPLFIFDPEDASNAPVPGFHDNAIAFWPIYPRFVRALFTRSFTTGLSDPRNGRVRESEWRRAMSDLRDAILYCAACGLENFYDRDELKASGRLRACWSCGAELRVPPRIRVGGAVVMLNHDARLYPHHVDPQRLYDFSAPVAEVAAHPTAPGLWGLRNVTERKWVATTADGTGRDVEPGRSVALAAGTRIQFGASEGEIRA
jgi:DNA-binding helix-hairpin-helix protein with protein kinase domain